MAISDKLQYLNETKQLIKNAINEDFNVISDEPFRKYASAISTINTAYNPFNDKIGYSTKVCEKALNKPLKVAYKSGYLKQETTSGKNLLNVLKLQNTESNGITAKIQKDGTILLNGTADGVADFYIYNSTDRLNLISGNTYTISRNTDKFHLIWHRYLSESSADRSDVIYMKSNIFNYTYTTKSTDYGYRFLLRVPNGTTLNNEDVKIQLEKGTTATSYEPYTGGNASPNPDYPQEIEVYEGVENLLYLHNGYSKTIYNVNVDISDDEVYFKGTPTNTYFGGDYFDLDKPLKENEWYYFKVDGEYSNCSFRIWCYTKTGTTIISGGNAVQNSSFKPLEDVYRYRLVIENLNQSLNYDLKIRFSITKGNVSHPYVPYKNDKYDENNPTLYPYHTNYALIKNSGKNLFDKDNVLMGKEIIGNTGNVQNNEEYFTTDYIKVEPNTNYFLSGKNGGRSNCFYDKNKTFITVIYNLVSGVITIPNNENICYMRFNAKVDSIDTTMITKGSTDTTYEPYREPTYTRIPLNNNFLAKIGDIKDEIDLVSGELRKIIGKFDLSTISWSYAGHNIENYKRYYTNRIDNIKYLSSNNEIGNGRATDYLITKGKGITSLTNVIAIDTSIVSVCSILSPTGLFYYELATQQVIQLGNSTIPMFNGTNILSLENDLENTFGITYFKE